MWSASAYVLLCLKIPHLCVFLYFQCRRDGSVNISYSNGEFNIYASSEFSYQFADMGFAWTSFDYWSCWLVLCIPSSGVRLMVWAFLKLESSFLTWSLLHFIFVLPFPLFVRSLVIFEFLLGSIFYFFFFIGCSLKFTVYIF